MVNRGERNGTELVSSLPGVSLAQGFYQSGDMRSRPVRCLCYLVHRDLWGPFQLKEPSGSRVSSIQLLLLSSGSRVTSTSRIAGRLGVHPVESLGGPVRSETKRKVFSKMKSRIFAVNTLGLGDLIIKCSPIIVLSSGASGSLTSFGFEWYSEPNILGKIDSPLPWVI